MYSQSGTPKGAALRVKFDIYDCNLVGVSLTYSVAVVLKLLKVSLRII